MKLCCYLLAWRSDWLFSLCRNIGLHWWERLSSLLPVLMPRREVARPGQQALGEETHHSGGERNLNRQCCALKDLKAVFQFGREGCFLLHILLSNFREIKLPKLPTQGSCSQQHFGSFVSALINCTETTKPEYWCWQLMVLVEKVFLLPSLYRLVHAENWKASTKL